jgi:hypothetical protein
MPQIDLLNPDAPIVPFETKTSNRLPQIKNFNVKEGKVERIMLIEPILYVLTHFKDRYLKCLKSSPTDDTYCPACKMVGKPKYRFATNVIVYKTDNNGDIIDPVQWEIMLWAHCDTAKINEIQRIKKEWKDLKAHDIKVSCSNQKFQNLGFTPTADAVWNRDADLHARILADYQQHRFDVEKIINKGMTAEEMEGFLIANNGDYAKPAVSASNSTKPTVQTAQPVVKSTPEVLDFDKMIQDL